MTACTWYPRLMDTKDQKESSINVFDDADLNMVFRHSDSEVY